MKSLKRHLSPPMIVAMVALFVALSGAAVAGVTLSNNTVRSNHIVNGQVKAVDLANNAATRAKINNNAVNGAKILDGSVASADIADGSVAAADLASGAVTPAKIAGVPTAHAFNNADVAVPNGAFTAIPLNSERFDATGMHRVDLDTSRMTISQPGIYLVTGNITWLANATGARELNIRKNGSIILARAVQPADGVNTADQIATTVVQLAAGDFVELVVRQNSGGPLTVAAAAEHSPEFSVAWIAPA